MRVSVNEMERELVAPDISVEGLLAELRYTLPVFVVELNGEAIPREAYSSTALAEGDRVEIYNLVDGG